MIDRNNADNCLAILIAQMNSVVGAIRANAEKIIGIIKLHQKVHDLIVFPELVLTGYPPLDLLFSQEFQKQVNEALQTIQIHIEDCFIIVGHPHWVDDKCFNALSIFYKRTLVTVYHKQALPNYGVFDEQRYFTKGEATACVLAIKNYRVGILICEDLWQKASVDQIIGVDVDGIICINASPFDYNKPLQRELLLTKISSRGVFIVYVNLVGGQDELVFDGQSLGFNNQGKLIARLPAFKEQFQTVTIHDNCFLSEISPLVTQIQLIYEALVCGLRDYVTKNNFSEIVLGLSGGIDSALTLAIAVAALGASKVFAVMMPSRYTSKLSVDAAKKQLKTLNVNSTLLSIEPAFESLLQTLDPILTGKDWDSTEENIQARIRGLLLMAISNKTGKLLLSTSNKSETAVGYATLYGDMAGGFCILKDVLKTQVYSLANFCNQNQQIIPEEVINRAPSAELADNQTDQDNLPEYHILDAIIIAYTQDNLSVEDIIKLGHSPKIVHRVINLICNSEHKRRQSAPGIKISPRAFGADWRYPISSGFVTE